jgi:hypothetical protein
MTARGLHARVLMRSTDTQRVATRLLILREARRAALSPILLAACVVAAWAMWGGWIDGQAPPLEYASDLYFSLFYNAWPLLLGAFLLGAWTLSRERLGTTQELFTAMPLSLWRRTVARLAVAAVPALAAVLVVGVQAVLVAGAGGVPLGDVGYQLHVMPTPVEWASIPVAAVASYTGGAAVYVLTRTRAVTVLVGAFVTFLGVMAYWLWAMPPASFISPIGSPVSEHVVTISQLQGVLDSPLAGPNTDDMTWRLLDPDPTLSAGHSLALLGMAALFAAFTLQRMAPDPRNRRLAWTGFAVVGAASIAQVAAYLL